MSSIFPSELADAKLAANRALDSYYKALRTGTSDERAKARAVLLEAQRKLDALDKAEGHDGAITA